MDDSEMGEEPPTRPAASSVNVIVMAPKSSGPAADSPTVRREVIVKNSAFQSVIRSTRDELAPRRPSPQPSPMETDDGTTASEDSMNYSPGEGASCSPRPSSSAQEGDGCSKFKRENPRDARNKAEKQRRDKLNNSINELATLVPLVAESSKKVDKTGILRLTAHDLRKDHVFGDSVSKRCHMDPPLSAVEAAVEMMGGFFITVTCKGIIVIVTANIEHYLGHCQIDLLGQNILNYTHPDDVESLKNNLMPYNIPAGPNGKLVLPSSILNRKDKMLKDERRTFQVRLARAVQRAENPQYELCKVEGSLRIADRANPHTSGQIIRRHRTRDENVFSSGNDVVFIGMVRVVKPTYFSERLVEASKLEYRTRHLVDGSIVHCDQRISIVAGYLTSEITGVSAFTFIHKDDVRWVIIALRQMYDRYNPFGETCYRLMTRCGDFIYLKTKGYLEINRHNNAVQTFVCINTLVSEVEGKALNEEMKKRYSVIIDTEDLFKINSGESTVEDPYSIEQAIIHLIANLPSCSQYPRTPSPTPTTPISQSLSIIPPKESSIKITIAKSVSVLKQALRHKTNELNKNIFSDNNMSKSIAQKSFDIGQNCDGVNMGNSKSSNGIGELFPLNNLESRNISNMPSITSNVNKMFITDVKVEEKDLQPIFNVDAKSNDINNFIESSSNAVENTYIPKAETSAVNMSCNDIFPLDSFVNNVTSENILNDELINNMLNKDSFIQPFNSYPNEVDYADLPSTSFVDPGDVFKMPTENSSLASTLHKKLPNMNSSLEEIDTDVLYNNENIEEVVNDMAIKEEMTDIYQLDELEIPQQAFDTYIDELTNPNADLCEVVPRSLAALECSMTQMDDNVQTINTQNPLLEQGQQENLSHIILEHEEQKQTFESIQSDYENRVNADVRRLPPPPPGN